MDNRQWLHWLFDKVVTTSAANFQDVAWFNWKEAAGVGTVFVNAAEGGAVGVLLQKWAFEDEFATGAATVALATAQRKGSDGVFFTEVCDDEPAQFAVSLPRT